MLFRVLTLCGSVFIVLVILTQVILPALLGKALFPLFRGESRLRRAERFRVEAIEKKQAAEREAEAIRVATEADAVDAEIIHRLTRP